MPEARIELYVLELRCQWPSGAHLHQVGSGKRLRGCGGAGTGYSRGALIRHVRVDGKIVAALVDCGCSVTLIGEAAVMGRPKGKCGVKLEKMNRSVVQARAVVHITSVLFEDEHELGPVDAYVHDLYTPFWSRDGVVVRRDFETWDFYLCRRQS